MSEREQLEKEIAAELGWTHGGCGSFTRNENGDIAWKASEYREIAEAQATALLSARLRLRKVEQDLEEQRAAYRIRKGLQESAESRLAQAGKLAAAARLHLETDPFSYTIHGDDTCQWCRRDRPSVDGPWSDEVWWSEDFHNSDCEGQRIATEAKSALLDWEKEA